ncbi:OprD family porin [Acidithiobacillus caldus]|nr:OprD family outer membrane porin [Acidithiobacillus caldus]MBU2821411.1 OprD family porin [Acidithiobacillus caldus]
MIVINATAYADSSANALKSVITDGTVDGQIRAYYFDRFFGKNATNLSAFSLGGFINAHTGYLAGFSADVGFYTANSLGANRVNPDVTLMGTQDSINALGQAYLQYEIPQIVLIRAGNQIVNTPWVNGADSRVIPATYQGVFAQVSPYRGWNIYGMRIFRWKSRTSGDYYRDNLYYKPNYDSDPIYGGVGGLPDTDPTSNGILAFGTSYKRYGINAQAWYYNFYSFAHTVYGDAQYTLKTGSGFDPFFGAQVNRQWEGNSLLNASLGSGAIVGGIPEGNGVNSTAWGVIGGIDYNGGSSLLGNGQLAASYNEIIYHQGAVGGGAIVSPYTAGYASDPLYTTSMIRGLVEMGPGNGWKVKWTQDFLSNQFLFMAAYAQYHLHTAGYANDIYGDLTYFPQGWIKGLSIRDRVEVAHGDLSTGYFIYNRVMLTYAF